MATYREQFASNETLIDARPRIGPHHLAIGKTRKLFEHDGVVHAFFSRGYEIAHTRLNGETLGIIDTRVLPLPVAWGGGAFFALIMPARMSRSYSCIATSMSFVMCRAGLRMARSLGKAGVRFA